MTTATTKLMRAAEFRDLTLLPENLDKSFELDRGVVVEVPLHGVRHGFVCGNVGRILGNFVRQRGKGYVCGNNTGIVIERSPDTVLGPDLFLVDVNKRYEELTDEFADGPPTMVVEVLAPEDRPERTRRRITQFLSAGVPLLWLVDPEERSVSVYRPQQDPEVVSMNGVLRGGEALPDLRYSVAEFFLLLGE